MAEKQSAVERALKAREEYEKTKDAAIEELLEARKKIDEQLHQLGYSETPPNSLGAGKGAAGKQRVCSYCKKPGHNAKTCPEKKATSASAAAKA